MTVVAPSCDQCQDPEPSSLDDDRGLCSDEVDEPSLLDGEHGERGELGEARNDLGENLFLSMWLAL
eukprot:CAMPEP_0114679800 /NCGR_PEP_ID=MMETSP0191-20121206/53322_1 /TAXON_ID=126664 /ORGANISM="Sorites sp." /LENGTH=65 /DNA_ID=CAMNT_0001955609 /DNA_START=76 /DNA_END=270 /DNA_ORIENTATION=-